MRSTPETTQIVDPDPPPSPEKKAEKKATGMRVDVPDDVAKQIREAVKTSEGEIDIATLKDLVAKAAFRSVRETGVGKLALDHIEQKLTGLRKKLAPPTK